VDDEDDLIVVQPYTLGCPPADGDDCPDPDDAADHVHLWEYNSLYVRAYRSPTREDRIEEIDEWTGTLPTLYLEGRGTTTVCGTPPVGFRACNGIVHCHPGHSAPARVVKVVSLEWETNPAVPGNPPLENCQNNEGKRIFPGLIAPDDADGWGRRQVDLVATIHPPVGGATVYFRVWDVDDPFDQLWGPSGPDEIEELPDVGLIDNDMTGPDNRVLGGASDNAPGFYYANTLENGEARVTIQVSMQPGNNYRAAATCLPNVLDGPSPQVGQADADALSVGDDGQGHFTRNGNFDYFRVPVRWSKMLTVWRKVWLELDSMGPGADIALSGTIDAIYDNDPHLLDGKFQYDVPDINDDGRFEGGTATVPSTGRGYTLIDNVDAIGDDYYITDGLIVHNDLGQVANVVDDDTAVLPKTPEVGTVLNSKYLPCYIQFTEDPNTRSYTNLFVATMPADSAAIAQKGFENSALAPCPELWVARVVTCYQGHHDASGSIASNVDGDPDKRYHIHGTSWSTGDVAGVLGFTPASGENVTLVLLEHINDTTAQVDAGYYPGYTPRSTVFMETRTIVHEIAHQFGITGHTPGTACGLWDGGDYDFDAAQILTIRASQELSSD
jgi:hypothetical protein